MTAMKTAGELSLWDIENELQMRGLNKSGISTPLAHLPSGELIVQLRIEQKGIYGVDDRKDYWEFPNESLKSLARSVVGLFNLNDVIDNNDGTCTLKTVPFKERRLLCATEKFREQPTGPFGSGFLVAPDIIATAGHCVNEADVTQRLFAFGFRMENNGAVVTIPSSDVYRGHAVVARTEDSGGPDWALVRLDRKVTDRPVLPIRRSGRIEDGTSVFVMGHPARLPIKFADGSIVRDNTPSSYFIANLDAYGGNSGSPVFGTDNVVEGVLVRGDADFTLAEGAACWVSKVCPTTGCQGEHCTRTTEFAKLVP